VRTVSLITRRELGEVFEGRGRVGRLILLGVALPLIFLLLLRSQAASPEYTTDRLRSAVRAIYAQMGIMPLSAAMAAAATSFATEFEAGTIIPLLAAPAPTSAVFWGKFLSAFITGVSLGWFAQGAFLVLFSPLTQRAWPVSASATFLISAAIPVFTLPFVAGAMALGSRARRVKAAQTNSSLAFVVILAAVLLVVFRRPPISASLIAWAVAGWLGFGVLLLTIGIRLWDREEVLGHPD
jgi:ABC-type transport system involved in multi-copper enzyme maturation permease subunit